MLKSITLITPSLFRSARGSNPGWPAFLPNAAFTSADLAIALADTGERNAAQHVLQAAASNPGSEDDLGLEFARAVIAFDAADPGAGTLARAAAEHARKAHARDCESRAESLLALILLEQGRGTKLGQWRLAPCPFHRHRTWRSRAWKRDSSMWRRELRWMTRPPPWPRLPTKRAKLVTFSSPFRSS